MYEPTTWIDRQTKLGPTNLNKLEQGIVDTQAMIGGSQAAVSNPAGSTYTDEATKIGNTPAGSNPFGQTGKGSPAEAFYPFYVDESFNKDAPNTNVPKTTQAGALFARYYGPTTDDSAEGFSAQAILPDTGAGAFTQAQPVVGLEGDALIQGSNIVTSKAIGVTAGAEGQNSAAITTAIGFYVAAKGARDAGVTITNWYGLYQETPAVVGTVTNKWGAYFHDDVQTEARLLVGVSGVQGIAARAWFVGKSTDTSGTLVAQAGSGQTSAQLVVRDSGNVARGQWFGSTGNLLIGSSATGGSGNGLISLVTASAPTGTPPAAGVFLYVDPADNKLKAKTSGGTVTVLTPTA